MPKLITTEKAFFLPKGFLPTARQIALQIHAMDALLKEAGLLEGDSISRFPIGGISGLVRDSLVQELSLLGHDTHFVDKDEEMSTVPSTLGLGVQNAR